MFLDSPGRQPPNTPLEESSAAVTRGNTIVLPTGLVPTHLIIIIVRAVFLHLHLLLEQDAVF